MGARRSLPIPSHPIRVRRSILPLPGPLPGEAKGGGGALTPPLGAWRVGAPGTLTPSFPAGALAPGWDGEGGESRGASARQALGRRRGRPRGPPLPEGPARSEGARARAPLRLLPSFPPSLLVDPVDQLSPRSPRSRGGRPPARVDQHPRGPTVPGRPAPRWRRLASATTRAAEAGPLALSRCDQPTWSPAPPRPLPPATRRARVSAPPRVDQQAVPSRPPPFPVRGT